MMPGSIQRHRWLLFAAFMLVTAQAAGQIRPASSAPASHPASAPDRDFSADRSSGYKLEPGPYEVALVDELLLYDKRRDKNLPLRIRYPKSVAADKKLPLILFSHGAGGAYDAFPQLSEHWASYGYVVIHPTHSDSVRLRRQRGDDLSGLRAEPERLRPSVDVIDRLADVALILDSLDKIEAKEPRLRTGDEGRIDRDRIGMAGHSAGAYTTQVAYGTMIRAPRRGAPSRDLSDPRIKAAILISGQGLTNRSLTEESWKNIRGPMMVFAGSLDVSAISNETPESRRHPYEYAPPGDKYLVYITGATHGSYQGRGLSRLLREEPTTDVKLITDAVAAGTLAFWDAYLLKDADAMKYLLSDQMAKFGGGAIEYKRK
jgi:predicted dienelactone hydrolase